MSASGTLRSGSPRTATCGERPAHLTVRGLGLPEPLPARSASFAHDLRNILSSVRGYAQLLLSMAHEESPTRRSRYGDGAKIAEYLAIIEAESSRCCELLERMLRPEERVPSQAEGAEDSASKSDAARAAEDRLT